MLHFLCRQGMRLKLQVEKNSAMYTWNISQSRKAGKYPVPTTVAQQPTTDVGCLADPKTNIMKREQRICCSDLSQISSSLGGMTKLNLPFH